MHINPHEIDDELALIINAWSSPPTAMQVFRMYDEITLMRDNEMLISHRAFIVLEEELEKAIVRDNITRKELSNRALWRDQDF